MSRPSRGRIPTLMAVALLCAAPALHAAPVAFDIGSASITAGSGYGIDTGSNPENGGTLLDVRFVNTFAAQAFALSQVGDSRVFDLATVTFSEPDIGSGGNLGIRNRELDGLGLSTRFDFGNPLGAAVELIAVVTAYAGAIDDTAVDYAISWNPAEADFGAGGRFRLSVGALSFTNVGTQTARATVELLAAPGQQAITAVPEPASAALVGVALAAAASVRRRRRV